MGKMESYSNSNLQLTLKSVFLVWTVSQSFSYVILKFHIYFHVIIVCLLISSTSLANFAAFLYLLALTKNKGHQYSFSGRSFSIFLLIYLFSEAAVQRCS